MVPFGRRRCSVHDDLTSGSARSPLTAEPLSPVFRTLRSMTRKRNPVLFLLVFALAGLLAACGGGDSNATSQGSTDESSAKLAPTTLNASGATFPMPFYEQVIAAFSETHDGVTINYGGGGSGKGRTDLQTGVVDWAGS